MKKYIVFLCAASTLLLLAACGRYVREASPPSAPDPAAATAANKEAEASKAGAVLQQYSQIKINTDKGNSIVFQLNDTKAAQALYDQLPLTLPAEDFGKSEKIFYTPERLDASDAPMANGPAGTLAYYEPWGNVAIFYEECKGASGLYRLGQVVSGIEFIEEISGQITLEKTDGGSTVSAITEQKAAEKPNPFNEETEQNDNQVNIELSTGSSSFMATIYNNEAAKKFAEMLPMTITMEDLNQNEKFYYMPDSLPSLAEQPSAINAGDLMLYGDDCLVLFYEGFTTSHSYTPLGSINDATGLKEALGNRGVQISFSLS